jgi:uncharacterized protein YdeI (BOF family)
MKFALIATALVLACSSAMAAGQGNGHGKDPKTPPAQGSFAANSHANPTALLNANANSVLSPVPEADAMAMLAAGAAIVGVVVLRRRNKK